MSFRALVMGVVACALSGSAWSFDVPAFEPNVVDRTGVLSATEVTDLNNTIAQLREQSRIFAGVLLVRSTDAETIEQAAVRTFEQWQLGQRDIDNGLLILVAIDDRKVRIETGYGLEGSIPDVQAKRIIDNVIVPAFKRQDYFDGVNAALQACNDLVLHGGAIELRPQPWWDAVPLKRKIKGVIWFVLIVVVPIVVRVVGVARAERYAEELRPTPQERSWWRLTFLSGLSLFVTLFLLVNPGIFFVMMNAFVAPLFLLFAYLFLGVANHGYLAFFKETWRRNFKSRPARGGDTYQPQAFSGGWGRGSGSSSSSSSSSSRSSSSSGGGRSGGGGASGSW